MKTVSLKRLEVVVPTASDEVLVIQNGKLVKSSKKNISSNESKIYSIEPGVEVNVGISAAVLVHLLYGADGSYAVFALGSTISQISIIHNNASVFSNIDEPGSVCLLRKSTAGDFFIKNNMSNRASVYVLAVCR